MMIDALPRQNASVTLDGVSKSFYAPSPAQLVKILAASKDAKVDASGVQVLKDLNFDVYAGEFFAVLGRNGAGKSTVLRAIGGIYGSSGTIVTLGTVFGVYELGPSHNSRQTGRNAVMRYLSEHGIPSTQWDKSVADIYEFSELGAFFDQPIQTYSSGMKSRLDFACATATQADIYLIDELLAVGDEHFKRKCWKRLKALVANGACGILVTHDWEAALKLCERGAYIENGELVMVGSISDVVARYIELPNLRKDMGHFLPDTISLELSEHQAHTSCDVRVGVNMEIGRNCRLGAMLETFDRKWGWEKAAYWVVDRQWLDPGQSSLRFKLGFLPVNAGSYKLNIYLVTQNQDEKEATVIDQLHWLFGNALDVTVDSPDTIGLLRTEVNWSV